MSIGTAESPVKVVLDTNILISALVYGGNPEKILRLALEKRIQVVISPILQAELVDIITKKFPLSLGDMHLLEYEIKRSFAIVHPYAKLTISRDEDDNRAIEAAVEGNCDFIITGDRDLLELAQYQEIRIVTPTQFLDYYLLGQA